MNKKVIHSVFESAVCRNGSTIAVESDTAYMTYSDLNAQANRLAHLLKSRKAAKGDIVATFFDDRLVQLLSLLGIFKSGAIYLPVDKKYKQNHWGELYGHIQPEILLTSEENFSLLKREYASLFDYSIPEVITVSADTGGKLAFSIYKMRNEVYEKEPVDFLIPDNNLELCVDGNDACYIFFTSGSTGRPKAVLGNHKSLSHFIHWEARELGINETDRVGQLTSYSFDASLKDVFITLICGAKLCIPPQQVKESIQDLLDWIGKEKITMIHTIPTMLRLLISEGNRQKTAFKFPHLRYLCLAGEKLYNKDVIDWRRTFDSRTQLINFYGTTESTILKTFYRIEDHLKGAESDVVCVGKPITNTVVLVLNSDNKLCRIREVGSIYIKTPFLSCGYYKEEELTSEKFVQNPLSEEHDIVYSTGDYGKYDEDRDIVVLGRKDGLVKLNGVRIDINSIESVLLGLKAVEMVKCIFHQNENNEPILVCFYKSESIAEEILREYCLQHLSDYEMPSFIVRLSEFPVNVNGKIDTIELEKKILNSLLAKDNHREASSEIEIKLKKIWEAVLEVEQVRMNDNFFALGGQSFKMIMLINRINEEFNMQINVKEFYANTTLITMSSLLQSKTKTKIERIKPVEDSEDGYALSNEQFRIWIASQSHAMSEAHHMHYVYKITGRFDVNLFREALQFIINRHEILRTCFHSNKFGDVAQFVTKNADINLFFEIRTSQSQETADFLLESFSKSDLDLIEGPLFKILLVQTKDDEHILYLMMHHILGDFSSHEVLIREIEKIYGHLLAGTAVELPELKFQYRDYANWINKKLHDNDFSGESSFWSEHLRGLSPVMKWHKTMMKEDFDGDNFIRPLEGEISAAILDYCRNNKCGLLSLMASALSLLIHKMSGQEDILICVPANLRNHPGLTDQIGLYLNLLPLRITVDKSQHVSHFLKGAAVKQAQLMDNSFYPFNAIVENFEREHHFTLNSRIDVYLNVTNQLKFNTAGNVPSALEFEILNKKTQKSKFPICFYINQFEDQITYRIEYQTSLFEPKEISRMGQRFQKGIEILLENPGSEISSLSLIDKSSVPTFNSFA